MTLRGEYSWLSFLRNIDGSCDTSAQRQWWREQVIETKRKIRKLTRKNNDDRRVVKHYDDGSFIELIKLPDYITDMEMAKDWFDENEKREYIPSPYDCTGQAFTEWCKIFQRNGRFMAYHSIGLDL